MTFSRDFLIPCPGIRQQVLRSLQFCLLPALFTCYNKPDNGTNCKDKANYKNCMGDDTMTKSSVSITGFQLKYLALVSMTIDHIGAVFFSAGSLPFLVCQAIGRLAFPVFCFLLTEGFFHTSDHSTYFKRLFLFALISEIPFDLALFHFPWESSIRQIFLHQNVFFTLSLGFLTLCLVERFWMENTFFSVLFFAAALFLAQTLRFDYGALGILLILFFYGIKRFLPRMPKPAAYALSLTPFFLIPGDRTGYFVILSVPFLCLYRGERGEPSFLGKRLPGEKLFFYWYYPAHLLLLAVIYCFK